MGFLDKLQKIGNDWGICVNEVKCTHCQTMIKVSFFNNPIGIRCPNCGNLTTVA